MRAGSSRGGAGRGALRFVGGAAGRGRIRLPNLPPRGEASTMSILPNDPWARAGALGIAAGLRSMTPLSALARAAREGGEGLPDGLRSAALGALIGLAAKGELFFDKLPVAPSRLEPGPLAARVSLGALVGALAVRRGGRSAVLGAGVGAAGALLGAFAGNRLRARAVEATGLPDTVFALVEDALALGLSQAGAGAKA